MKDWFKARNIWGAAMSALSDEEAGRLAKAIWAFTMNGEVREIDGAGKGILAMILLTLGQDAERDGEISVKRSMATAGIRNQKKSDDIKSHQMISSDIKSHQMISSDDNKNKNKNIDKEQESESGLIADAEAIHIQADHNRVLDAAEDAGFKLTNNVNAALIALYADFGLEKVLEGIKSCSEHGVANLAYLRACVKGESKKPGVKPRVNAQDYEQRDYQNVQDEILRAQERRIAERLQGVS